MDVFAKSVFKAYKLYETINAIDYKRQCVVQMHIYTAIQNLVSAFNIFISGYMVAPGNLMRQFYESVAWAILCSTGKLEFFNNFLNKIMGNINKQKLNIQYHKALDYVQQNLRFFNNIDSAAWNKFMKTRDFYHKLSHSSPLAISTNAIMCGQGVILGSYYDPGKVKQYSKQIKGMINATDVLSNIIEGLKTQIKSENL